MKNDPFYRTEILLYILNSNLINLSLSASGWSGTNAPYSYSISNSKITVNNILDLIINTNTQELVDALNSYQISGYKQEAGKLTIYAWGEKPSTDVPAIMVIRGGI